MPDQNFETDQNQDDAAGPFCFGLVEDSEYSADFNADHGKYERGAADKADCLQNPDIQKCESDADGQCVNAGGYGQKQHGFDIDGGITGLSLMVHGFLHHVKTNDAKQNKRNPMIVRFDGTLETDTQHIADPGHESLEAAKIQADDERMLYAHLLHGKALTDGNGKGVHGKPCCQKK